VVRPIRLLLPLLAAVGLFGAAAPGFARAQAYPDTADYSAVSSREIYRVVDEDGVWLTTPLGLRCAIEEDGSYGCSAQLPGVPPGDDEVAWFLGDAFPRLYAAEQPRFSSAAGQTILTGLSYLEYRGSRCSVTRESAFYCIHGDDPNSQLMITSAAVFRGPDARPA
jgi:hypothetical protein